MVRTSADATSLSPWWRHSVILVMIAGFSVLSLVTVLTYTNAPPIPVQAVDAKGAVVFTGADIRSGPGSIFQVRPHGARDPVGPWSLPGS